MIQPLEEIAEREKALIEGFHDPRIAVLCRRCNLPDADVRQGEFATVIGKSAYRGLGGGELLDTSSLDTPELGNSSSSSSSSNRSSSWTSVLD